MASASIQELVDFVRARMLGVVATVSADGGPEAALVGLAATDLGELVFDTSRDSRKFANIAGGSRVAVVLGGEEEVTLQVEGAPDLPEGADLQRCREAYFARFPEGRDRADEPEIALVRVTPTWTRLSDYRPESFGSHEATLG